MNKLENKYIKPLMFFCITVVFSVLAAIVDRQPVGYGGTSVGFSSLNSLVSNIVGYNEAMDKVSDVMMALSFLVVASFGIMGLMRLIREKDLAKVGKVLWGLGFLYVIIAVLYFAFNKIPVNYRPILPPGETELETSYPSTHTLVICSVMGSAIVAWKRLFFNKKMTKILTICAVVVIVVGVTSRLLAGVHWLSDIVAGILFSTTLVSLYSAWSAD